MKHQPTEGGILITKERLAHLQRDAELGVLTTGGGRGISGAEVIELIKVYRERSALQLGEMERSVSGDAFLGAMIGGFVGRLLERPKGATCEATRGGRRCTLPLGHDTRHSWGPLTPSDTKAKKR